MEKTKKPRGSRRFLIHYITPALLICIVGAVSGAIGVPLAIYFDNKIVLYILSAGAASILLGGLITFFVLINRYGATIENSFMSLEKQLEDFSKGDIKLSSTVHKLPGTNRLQGKLNAAIQRFSNYRLLYNDLNDDESVKALCKEGHVFDLEEWKTHLYEEIQSNLSFRSAVLLVKMSEENPPEEVMESLHKSILKRFPLSLIGRYDKATFSVYVQAINSLISFENSCARLSASFNELLVSSHDDAAIIYYCRIGASIYPYTPMGGLLESAEAALDSGKEICVDKGSKTCYFPHAILSESNRRIVALSSIEAFEESFKTADTYIDQLDVLKRFVRWFSVISDFEVGGICLYNSFTKEYRLLFESGKEKEFRSLSLLGKSIPGESLDPFFDAGMDDPSFSCCDVSDLPVKMSNFLANLGVKSSFFHSVSFHGRKQGLIYLTSSKTRPFFTIANRELLNVFCALGSTWVCSIDEEKAKKSRDELLGSLSSKNNQFIYSIDRPTHRLTYLSENLLKAFPDAKVGDYCYKALRKDHTAPCSHCPLEQGTDRRIIGNISTLESAVSVLSYHEKIDNVASIIIEKPNENRSGLAESSLMDKMLFIKNKQALSLDVGRELKLGAFGYVVSFSLLNFKEIFNKLPDLDANALMMAIVRRIEDDGYGDVVYRYEDFTLTFLLRSYTKKKIVDFVEELAALLDDPIDLKDVSFHPSFAFSLVSYPNDASTSRETIALISSELKRSQGYGPGFLLEVAAKKPRRALRKEYILETLNSTLEKGSMPIEVQPIVSGPDSTIVGGDVLARLYGRDGQAIPPGEFIPVALENGLGNKVDLAVLAATGELYSNNAYTIFKSVGLQNLSLHISYNCFASPEFIDEVKKIISRYKIPKGFINFQLAASMITGNGSILAPVITTLFDMGIIFEASDYEPQSVSLEDLRKLGIFYIKTARSMVGEAISTPADYSSFSRFVDAAIRGGFHVNCAGVETKEEKDLCDHLEILRRQGYYFAKTLSIKEFISFITYGK